MQHHEAGLPSVHLVSLATAVPPHVLEQNDVARRAAGLFGGGEAEAERFASVYRNAGINARQSTVPLEWYLEDHGAAERSARYLESALTLAVAATEQALARAGLAAADIDAIIAVSSTGIATPSLDARLMDVLAFRRNTVRLPIFGLGCAGGVMGMARAASIASSMPGSRVLLVVVELCGLTFRKGDQSKSNRVATALFGDGAVALILGADGDGPVLGPSGEHTWPGTLDVMGWDVVEDGLKVVFSRDIPSLVRAEVLPATEGFLADHGMTLADIDGYICHPGGARVLDALEAVFALPRGGLADAREVLRDHGNMSAPTVLFVLEAAIRAGKRGRQLMIALGPGFTVAFQIIELG